MSSQQSNSETREALRELRERAEEEGRGMYPPAGNPARLREAPVTGIERMAVNLTKAWARYVALFTVPPHGTEKQMAALIELCPQLKEAIRLFEKQREEGMTV